ncbi:hypothetical protein DBR47_18105 [Paucibacter sp. KBW04]|uniref:flagellar hook-length control protein FliK n=1 Tax=Paucibacter sp. KBW04 TaxID=2153361 RepID=UPI000F568EE3|nr:flagellar hook-length control protein FliK [Paucibacter sp. KBW04]RQO56428.1 hypothetical protein DBR47_18105 [Paucibacter sp. KBW04]
MPPPSQTAQQEQAHAESNGSASKDLERSTTARREAQQQEARLTARRSQNGGGNASGNGITDRVGRSTQPTPAYTGKVALPAEDGGTPKPEASEIAAQGEEAVASSASAKSKKAEAKDGSEDAAASDANGTNASKPDIDAKAVLPVSDQAGGRPYGGNGGGPGDEDDKPGKPQASSDETGPLLAAHHVRRGGANALDGAGGATQAAASRSASASAEALDKRTAEGADKATAALFGQTSQAAGASAAAGPAAAPAAEAGADFSAALNAATAGTAAGTAAGSASAAARPEATPMGSNPILLAQPLHSPAFVPEMAARLSVLAAEGVQEAQLHLNPSEMGPVAVQIVVDGQQAQISFHAENAETRAVLERGLPDLAAALRDNGLTLSGGGVFQQQMNQQGQASAQAGDEGRRANRPSDRSTLPIEQNVGGLGQPISSRKSQGVVDLYA